MISHVADADLVNRPGDYRPRLTLRTAPLLPFNGLLTLASTRTCQQPITLRQPARRGDLAGHLKVPAVAAAVERVLEEAQPEPETEEVIATSGDRADDNEDNVRGRHGKSIGPDHSHEDEPRRASPSPHMAG